MQCIHDTKRLVRLKLNFEMRAKNFTSARVNFIQNCFLSQVSNLSDHCWPAYNYFRTYLSRIKVLEPVKIPTAITSKKGISEQKEKSHLGDPTHLKRSELLPRGEAQQQSRAI